MSKIPDIECNRQLLCTYIPGYFISTGRRACSAVAYSGLYYETIVWIWDQETRQTTKIAYGPDDSGPTADMAFERHYQIVSRAMKGKLPEEASE